MRRSLKIAMMVRSFIPVPRPADMVYAPIDLAEAIAEGLARRGHQVDFYAPIGSKVKRANVVDCNLRPLIKNYPQLIEIRNDPLRSSHYLTALWDEKMASVMFERALKGRYDILHFHHLETSLQLARANPKIPVVYTAHDPIYSFYAELFELYRSPNQYFVSISNNQRRDGPDLPFLATVHNGINVKDYNFSSRPDGYLLYVGRIVPEKGVKEAIAVAKATKHRLLIVGPIFPESQGYFDQYIKPSLDENILYLGYIERDSLARYYSKAKALLTPVQWEEPFGMTTIEAMACGTPIISFRRGAAPEIIKHGKTGFVVDTTAEMIEAVGRVKNLSRAECRRYVERSFSLKKMVDGYEAAFEQALQSQLWKNTSPVTRKLRRTPEVLKKIPRSRAIKQIIKKTKLS